MHLFIVNMFWLISLFLQRPHGTIYRIVQRILFCILEFKMRQYPDIRVGRQETGRKKNKKQWDIAENVSRSKLGKEFSISHCSSWKELLTERGLEQIQAKNKPTSQVQTPVCVWPITYDYFYILNGWKNQKKNSIVWLMDIIWNSNFSVHKKMFSWNTTTSTC